MNYIQAKSQVNAGDRNPKLTVTVEFDEKSNFSICPASLTPVYDDQDNVQDTYTGAIYHSQYRGSLCRLTGVNSIGSQATGLRSYV